MNGSPTKPTTRPTARPEPLVPEGPSTTARLETELAVFARTLEGLSRRSAIHRDLDRASYLLARTLVAHGPSSIGTLATRLHLDATTVTRQVNTMERAGLVRRRRDPVDARIWHIELSAAGRRQMAKVRAAREVRVEQLVASWSEADRRRFSGLLGRFNAALHDIG